MGYRWATLELDDYNNAPRWETFRAACHAEGMLAGPWFTEGANTALTPPDADFTIAECESENDRLGAIASAPSLPSAMPRAIVTNFTPMTDDQGVPLWHKAAPLVEQGWTCLTEAYMGDNPNASPERLHYRATVQLGFPSSQPVFGVWNKPLAEYGQWMTWPGWSAYLAEYLI